MTDIVDALVQISFEVQSILGRIGAEHDLSLTQIRLLGIIRDRDAGTIELAGHLRLDKSSVSGLVDRAERRDLVRRAPSPTDGRSIRVVPTAHGREMIALVEEAISAEITRLTGHLSPRDRTALARIACALIVPFGNEGQAGVVRK